MDMDRDRDMDGGIDHGLVESFLDNGVVVIPNVLTAEEIAEARQGFHQTLRSYGCDVEDLEHTAKALEKLSSTYGSGGVLDLFYFDWKLRLNENPKVVVSLQTLWKHSYAAYDSTSDSADSTFAHPFGQFDPSRGYIYIDRVCFRLPSELSSSLGKNTKTPLQRSLTPHLDCCPLERFSGRKWRPIQAFLCLTDTVERDLGGFEVCPGMHKDFDDWARNRPVSSKDGKPAPCVGQFSPIRPKEDKDIMDRMQHIPCRYES
jgi:CheY-like chemotaxis protein